MTKKKEFNSLKTLKRMGLIPRTRHYEQMKVFAIVSLVILAFMGLVYLGIKYPPKHIPLEYYMDGPVNPLTPHIAVDHVSYTYPEALECICGNDPDCMFPWQQPKGKYDNYV